MKTLESNTNPHAAGKAAHSPLPWRVNGNHIEARPDPENSDTYWAEVAYLDTEWFERITEANAQFIVRACNSHAALVDALQRMVHPMAGEDDMDHASALLATLEATP